MAASLVEQEIVNGSLHGLSQRIFKKSYLFTDADPAAGITDEDIDDTLGGNGGMSGKLAAARVSFGETAPDALSIAIKDREGVTIASGDLTAPGALTISQPLPFVGGLNISITGNAVAAAQATISLYVS